ncbi:hypothetical protein CGCA056_v012214 [Colletotrichum aenigma]|uniref:uncharacterized protein n=1 Tax=Colletotrichum aenigma TaxID=1215731 RepID=UPI0018722E71|nr:uncharacterized protein CGCA056_v012214 [Colletotrichum aenigma]KAF5512150.1 hypothetical protein CGCA056_v012214 [Colletotrichum aenigma]
MFTRLRRGSSRAITKTITSRASNYKPQVPSRHPIFNPSTAFQSLPRRQNFSSEAPNASRERLGNKDALEATRKAYEARRLTLQTETQRKLDAAKEQFQKEIETHRTELGYANPGRDTTESALDFIRRKPLVAVDLRESAPTCKWYVQKLEEAAASEKEWRAWKWEQVRQGAFFTVIFLVLNNVADSVLNHYGIRHARSPPAKTIEVDKKGEEEKSVRDVEVATVTAKE